MTTLPPALRRRLIVLAASLATVLGGAVATAVPAHAAPAAIAAPSTGKSGALIVLSGTSWPAYASVNLFLVRMATPHFVCTLTADSTGALPSQTCTVPTNLPAASYTSHADDNHGHTADAANAFALKSSIGLVSTNNSQPTSTVAAGSTLGLTGHGFAGGVAVASVKLGTATVATSPASPVFDANGTVSGITFTVPVAQAAGPLVVKLTDANANAATYQVQVYRAKVTAPAGGAASETLALSGTAWPAGHAANAYVIAGATTAFMCTLHADNTGAIPTQDCLVPTSLPAGADTLQVTDGFVTVRQPFAVTPSITPYSTFNAQPTTSVAAGSTLGLLGHGFASNSTLTVKLGTKSLVTNPNPAMSDVNGSFTNVTVTIPAATAAGTPLLRVADSAGHARTYKIAVLKPTVTAPAAGPANTSMVVRGSGWVPGSSVNTYLAVGASNNFMCTLHADDAGAVGPQSCIVPAGVPAGSYTLVLTDQSVTVRKGFTVQPKISVTNAGLPLASGPPGTALTLTGWGFTASSTVSAKLGPKNLNLVPATPGTASNGVFSGVTCSVPNMATGTYTLTVTDAAGKKGTVQFTVT